MTDTITLRKLAESATQGPWVKGKTTHHTVTNKGYHIAEWHHADDAALMDALYPQKVIELLDEIDSLRAALAQQAEQGWVSLNDWLPKPNQIVLVARGKFVTTGSYSPAFGWGWEHLDGEDDDSVATHWMPLPKPPKETK